MPGLAATGNLIYNGYTFDGASHVDVSAEFIYDDANRVITAHKYTIRVRAIIANDTAGSTADLDADTLNIRKRLGIAGQTLNFTGKGFGDDLLVGPATQVRDIDNGPRPKELSWKPIGDDKAAEIVWQIETTVAVCPDGLQQKNVGFTAFNYQTTWAIDNHGDTTRTLTGYLEIAHQHGSRKDSADKFREKVNVPEVTGFTRNQNWTLTSNRRRLNFTVVDTEIPSRNPYPRGVTDMKASHRVTWTRGKDGGQRYFNVLSASITPESRLSGSWAWRVFAQLYARRKKAAKEGATNIMLENLTVEEDLFGRTHNFLVRYSFLSSITDFVGDSGLWEPLGSTWMRWHQSLDDGVFDNRGHAQLRESGNLDIIVSICGGRVRSPTADDKRKKTQRGDKEPKAVQDEFENEMPTADKSYKNYRMDVETIKEQPTAKHQFIQKSIADSGGRNPNVAGSPTAGLQYPSASGSLNDVVQVAGTPSYKLILTGNAQRLGWKIVRPAIVKVGSAIATETSGRFKQRIVGWFFNQPLYEAFWRSEYTIDRSPSTVEPTETLMEQTWKEIGPPKNIWGN